MKIPQRQKFPAKKLISCYGEFLIKIFEYCDYISSNNLNFKKVIYLELSITFNFLKEIFKMVP